MPFAHRWPVLRHTAGHEHPPPNGRPPPRLGARGRAPHRGRLPAQQRHPPDPAAAAGLAGSTSTSRTSPATPPAASSTGWRAACSCTRCATAGCTRRSTVVEASSGSTAISEAYFARLLGLPFIAVMPDTTSREKIAAIEFQGGRCHLVADPRAIYGESQRLADETGGRFLDQFTFRPSAPPTGAPTTTSPRASSRRCGASATPARPGSWPAPAPAARWPPSAATCATAGSTPGCAASTPSAASSSTTTAAAPPARQQRPQPLGDGVAHGVDEHLRGCARSRC
jgi:hypothetical protein